jgi:hypothetical protein
MTPYETSNKLERYVAVFSKLTRRLPHDVHIFMLIILFIYVDDFKLTGPRGLGN